MTPISMENSEGSSQTVNPFGTSSIVLVCEHATYFIPDCFDNLGLTPETQKSHAAWDPGAAEVAKILSKTLDAVLVVGVVSRLVYDCNRPPSVPEAMPAHSEIFDVPGNMDLSSSEKSGRVEKFYEPFRASLAEVIAQTDNPVVVTIHSFTPVYHGKRRDVEIGILHDSDARLADAMLDVKTQHTPADVQRNQPYGPEHGVMHTLKEHAISGGHLNVMLEIRNDLIETENQQHAMANRIAAWLANAIDETDANRDVQCVA